MAHTPSRRPDARRAGPPALATDPRDGSVWAAWVQTDCGDAGLRVQRINPATGAAAGPATPVPGGAGVTDMFGAPALVEVPGVGLQVAYVGTRSGRDAVMVWTVGAPTSRVVDPRAVQPRHVLAAAEPAGSGVWIGWSEPQGFELVRTAPTQAFAVAPVSVESPGEDPGQPIRDAKWTLLCPTDGQVEVVYDETTQAGGAGRLLHTSIGG